MAKIGSSCRNPRICPSGHEMNSRRIVAGDGIRVFAAFLPQARPADILDTSQLPRLSLGLDLRQAQPCPATSPAVTRTTTGSPWHRSSGPQDLRPLRLPHASELQCRLTLLQWSTSQVKASTSDAASSRFRQSSQKPHAADIGPMVWELDAPRRPTGLVK